MRIREASTDEADALTAIAQDAKRHWGYPDHWIQRWESDLTISSDFVSSNPVYVAEQDGELMGFYALIVRDGKAELEHMWVVPRFIGQGIGKELFIHAMQEAAGQNVSAVEISSDPNAEGFYRKMGAKKIGEVASEIDGEQRILPRLSVKPNRS
jgi:GNAT superfamily N-acetyltransferase